MAAFLVDTRLADLLVELGIIVDKNAVRKVTIELEAGCVAMARIEQYVDRVDLETIVRRLRVDDDPTP